jgi:hypothetical protein
MGWELLRRRQRERVRLARQPERGEDRRQHIRERGLAVPHAGKDGCHAVCKHG